MNTQKPVLVYVEDDENSIVVMRMVAEKLMDVHSLHILKSGADFVQQVNRLGVMPDIFLLDIHMKPYDGFELLSMLRKDPQFRDRKIIALTASVTNQEVALLKNGGFDGAIAKPLNIDIFPGLIAKVMNNESVWFIT
jgi:CheY-like chemotaxis protein